MNVLAAFFARLHRLAHLGLVLFSAALGSLTALRAGITGPGSVVGYTPSVVQIQGVLPLSQTYSFDLTSPGDFVGPSTISFVLSTNGVPAGVTDATALSYLSISPATLNYSTSSEPKTVTVTLAIPYSAAPGSYGYKILAVGWPGTPTNTGTFISASMSAPLSSSTPPDVSIVNPADGSVLTAASFPLSIPVTFTASSSGAQASPITNASMSLAGVNIALSSLTGLNTLSVSGSGIIAITAPGTYQLVAQAVNSGGSVSDTNTFTVINAGAVPPPVAVISAPILGATYTYRAGGAAVAVPFTFSANASDGPIRTLVAKVDGIAVPFTASGLNTLAASGVIPLSYTIAGEHFLEITTTNDGGSATATTSFSVNVMSPTPVVTIVSPALNASFTLPVGAASLSIPFSFGTTTSTGFTVDTISATLDGVPVTITTNSPAVLGTATAVTSSGNLLNVGPGTHTLIATATSAGVVDSDAVTFSVQAPQVSLPTVLINTPLLGSTYTILLASSSSCNGSVTVPLSFVGTSTASTAVITQLSATLDGRAVAVSSSPLNQKSVTGTASLVLTTSGTHTIGVTATDACGVASATRTFQVVVVFSKNICGRVFFDVNFDGVFDGGEHEDTGSRYDDDRRGYRSDRYSDQGSCRDLGDRYNSRYDDDDRNCPDFGLSGVTITLLSASGATVATTVSDSSGRYCFTGVAPGTYSVTLGALVGFAGFSPTTLSSRAVTVTTQNVLVRDFGLGLNFSAIRTFCATGKPVEFWKVQIDKCIKNDRSAEVSADKVNSYLKAIGSMCLSLFDRYSLKQSTGTMGAGSSEVRVQLAKQLLAAEFNFANGSYINGHRMLTYCFIQWGERTHSVTSCAKYSTSYCNTATAWFKAYNCSQGGIVSGPN
ncbi:MAG: hypothetical protein RL077_1546 [Verrucomicrobiota bacterium]